MTREEAIQAWEQMRSEIDKENWLFVGTINPLMIDMAIEALSERTGEWIREEEYGDLWVCDQCGFASEHNYSFCSICGAMMIGGEDE